MQPIIVERAVRPADFTAILKKVVEEVDVSGNLEVLLPHPRPPPLFVPRSSSPPLTHFRSLTLARSLPLTLLAHSFYADSLSFNFSRSLSRSLYLVTRLTLGALKHASSTCTQGYSLTLSHSLSSAHSLTHSLSLSLSLSLSSPLLSLSFSLSLFLSYSYSHSQSITFSLSHALSLCLLLSRFPTLSLSPSPCMYLSLLSLLFSLSRALSSLPSFIPSLFAPCLCLCVCLSSSLRFALFVSFSAYLHPSFILLSISYPPSLSIHLYSLHPHLLYLWIDLCPHLFHSLCVLLIL